MPALKEFREDASRAVYVTGDIDEELVNRLTPVICGERGLSGDPITVYISSRGGYIQCADQIRELLIAPDQEGRVCRIITVATTRADSAAAGMLALGDYAIIYPSCSLHCHGSRMAHPEITSERAEFLAASLKRTNDDFALRLARRSFARLAFLFANLRSEFPEIQRDVHETYPEKEIAGELECFAMALHKRVSSDAQQLPKRAFFHQQRLSQMSSFIFSQHFQTSDEWFKTEVELLKRLIDYELSSVKSDKWSLSDGGIDEIAADFKSFADYLFGPHQETLESHIESFGVLFLTGDQVQEYQRRRSEDVTGSANWLREQANPLVEPMWYFVVSLCRLLQEGEYALTATDAYWLGIVDEVIGEQIPSLRLIAENPET